MSVPLYSALALLLIILLYPRIQYSNQDEYRELVIEADLLEQEIESLEAENEIENLQRIFGFYFDKKLWSQAADLFTDNATVELGGDGIYVGKHKILEYFRTFGAEGPEEGVLNDHMQLQPVINLLSKTEARGRWHLFSQEAEFGKNHFWGTGVYENEYKKENGIWKISRLHLYSIMRTPYDKGWAKAALPRSTPGEYFPPDQPSSIDYENYPSVFVPPFHFKNPVTGNRETLTEPEHKELSAQGLTALMDDLEKRIVLLQDADEVERLQAVYGYYLARNQWDDLTGIFAPEGTIEIAQRGVYRGHKGIRRNLNLYGVQDQLPGQLHNHMQYQPVIHVSKNGQTAYMRSRAFSMMGSYEGSGMWMGGVYENIFVKRNGVWMLYKDQVFNTYFATYDQGWKDLQRRNPPGINNENPPDSPPSVYFEMYPSAFLPPFHYPNPVTGKK
ncbi:nuclear transport factor 2 family protein [Thermodesulfobacteriota bacterium]